MTPEAYREQIEEFTQTIKALTHTHREVTDYKNGLPWDERRVLTRKFEVARKKLEGKIKYRENKLAALDGPPEHKDVFGQVFKVGQRVAWSSSSKYAGATLGWVVGITPKMVSVSGLRSWKPDSYGTALMPRALIICDAIVASLEDDDDN